MDTRRGIPDFGAAWTGVTMQARLVGQLSPYDANDLKECLDDAEEQGIGEDPSVILALVLDHLRRVIACGERMVTFLNNPTVRETLKGLEYDEGLEAIADAIERIEQHGTCSQEYADCHQ